MIVWTEEKAALNVLEVFGSLPGLWANSEKSQVLRLNLKWDTIHFNMLGFVIFS